jgi:ElaB/YqjD/DUF883 family membrane-anchored ribosome-binding protein
LQRLEQQELPMIEEKLTGTRPLESLLNHPALGDTPAQIKAKADELVLNIQEKFERARLAANQGRDDVDLFVRTKPYAALAIAGVAGLVIGHLLSAGRPNVVYLKDTRRP